MDLYVLNEMEYTEDISRLQKGEMMNPWSVFPEDDMPNKVIGLCGTAGSGKTTFALICQRKYGAKIASMAEPIRRIADFMMMPSDVEGVQNPSGWMATRNFIDDLFPSNSKEDRNKIMADITALFHECHPKTGEKNRTFLQKIGTDIGRKRDPNVWVNWRKTHMPGGLVVVDDVRFPDEMQMILDLGGKMYRVVRPELDRLQYLIEKQGSITKEQLNHPSETSLKDVQMRTVFANNLAELEDGVESIMEGG